MAKVRVVVADDHALVRIGTCESLSNNPNLEIVGEAQNGETLSEVLARTNPDLLLIDVVMPGFRPLDVIPQIQVQHPGMKILVISAYDDNVYVEGLLKAGVDGYHLKGESLSELHLAIERVLAGGRWVSSSLIDSLVTCLEDHSLPITLTARQIELLQLLRHGLDNKTIARRLGLSVKTVENHLTRLYRRIDVQSRAEAINYAFCYSDMIKSSRHHEPSGEARLEPAVLGGPTVLLVDDNSRYRRQLRSMIARVHRGGRVLEAGNCTEALLWTQHARPDLVLLDVILGEENGIHCARRLTSRLPSARIVMISAYPDREFHRLALEAGAMAFLDKSDLDSDVLSKIFDDIKPGGRCHGQPE